MASSWANVYPRLILVAVAVALVIPGGVALFGYPVDYQNLKTAVLVLAYLTYTIVAASVGASSLVVSKELEQISRIEERNQYLLVGVSIVVGFLTARGAEEIGLPPTGFDLLVLGACYAIVGLIPFPLEWRQVPDESRSTSLTLVRAIKAQFSAASAATSFLVIANLLVYRK